MAPSPHSSSPSAPVTLLYIGGSGRNGSTLLDRLLGQLPGVVAVGELVHLPQRGLLDDELCGCGTPFSQCPFWAEVGDRAFGGWGSVDAVALRSLQRAVDRNRFIPRLVRGTTAELSRWTDALSAIVRAIADTAGARVVVDASKHASTAFAWRRVPGVDLRVVHLTRDSRGVAYSWSKTVARPEARPGSAEGDEMLRLSPLRSSVRWVAYNALFDALRATGVPVTNVRYEQLVADPSRELGLVTAAAGLGADAGRALVRDGRAVLDPTHSVAGNPSRFRHGPVELRPDDEWRTAMPAGARRLVTLTSGPLLLRHGYPLVPGRSA